MLVNVPWKSISVRLEQSLKALSPMESMAPAAETDLREVQPLNMDAGTFVNEAGNETLVKEVQSLNTLTIVSLKATPSGNSMLLRDFALVKVAFPEMSLSVDGRLISKRLLHPLTIEPALISSTPSSKVSFSSALAFCSMQLKSLMEPGIQSSLTLTNFEKNHPLSFSSVSGRSSCSTSSAVVPPENLRLVTLYASPSCSIEAGTLALVTPLSATIHVISAVPSTAVSHVYVTRS